MTDKCQALYQMRLILSVISAAALLVLPFMSAHAGETREPYGIGLEGFAYPYPVNMLPLVNDGEQVRMAYMDVAPAQPNGRTVVLLHGRNFPASYWAPIIKTLNQVGYRVVGFDPDDLRKFRRYIAEPYGMVLVTGPTGSGKTTTLYAAVSEIRTEEDKIITIEDPV